MEKETVILTCSSLERYVKRAQEKMHTNYPIIVIDRIYHVEPATMKTVIWQELEKRKRKPVRFWLPWDFAEEFGTRCGHR